MDTAPARKSSKSGVERMLEFGKELYQISQRLEKENGANETNRKMLEVSRKIQCDSVYVVDKNRNGNITFIFVYLFEGCI